MSRRTDKLAHLIQREVSDILQRDLHNPHIGFVTITRVKVSPDLRNAILFVSVLGEQVVIEDSMKHLRRSLGFIKRRVAPRLDLRYTPNLSIVHDDTELKAERLEQLIDDLHLSHEEESDPEEG